MIPHQTIAEAWGNDRLDWICVRFCPSDIYIRSATSRPVRNRSGPAEPVAPLFCVVRFAHRQAPFAPESDAALTHRILPSATVSKGGKKFNCGDRAKRSRYSIPRSTSDKVSLLRLLPSAWASEPSPTNCSTTWRRNLSRSSNKYRALGEDGWVPRLNRPSETGRGLVAATSSRVRGERPGVSERDNRLDIPLLRCPTPAVLIEHQSDDSAVMKRDDLPILKRAKQLCQIGFQIGSPRFFTSARHDKAEGMADVWRFN